MVVKVYNKNQQNFNKNNLEYFKNKGNLVKLNNGVEFFVFKKGKR